MKDSTAYGVYRIVAPSGSCYIGMTAQSFDARFSGHLKDFRLKRMKCSGLQRAFDKYGVEAMVFEILEDMTGYGQEEILYRERQWWLLHRPWVNLYNGEPTGRGAVIHTEETRTKISRESLVLRLRRLPDKGRPLDEDLAIFLESRGIQFDPNKPPFVPTLSVNCSDCGKRMKRVRKDGKSICMQCSADQRSVQQNAQYGSLIESMLNDGKSLRAIEQEISLDRRYIAKIAEARGFMFNMRFRGAV